MMTLNLQRASKRQGNSGVRWVWYLQHVVISQGKKWWVLIDQCGKQRYSFPGISCLMSPQQQQKDDIFSKKNHCHTQIACFFLYAWIYHIGPGFVGLVCLKSAIWTEVMPWGPRGAGWWSLQRRRCGATMDMVCHTDDLQKYGIC